MKLTVVSFFGDKPAAYADLGVIGDKPNRLLRARLT